MREPAGGQAGCLLSIDGGVSVRTLRPSKSTTAGTIVWANGGAAATVWWVKTMRRPSGDHAGYNSFPGSVVGGDDLPGIAKAPHRCLSMGRRDQRFSP
jgi:hypothetical protein